MSHTQLTYLPDTHIEVSVHSPRSKVNVDVNYFSCYTPPNDTDNQTVHMNITGIGLIKVNRVSGTIHT